jgi:hypothetical protein
MSPSGIEPRFSIQTVVQFLYRLCYPVSLNKRRVLDKVRTLRSHMSRLNVFLWIQVKIQQSKHIAFSVLTVCIDTALFVSANVLHIQTLMSISNRIYYSLFCEDSWFSLAYHIQKRRSTLHTFILCAVIFVSAFAKLRKATISFVMSVLPPTASIFNLTFTFFPKLCRENSSFIQIRQEHRVLYMRLFSHIWKYLAEFFSEWETYQIKVVEKIKTHLSSKTFFRKSCCPWDKIKKYGGA